jgi:hypothetical protein
VLIALGTGAAAQAAQLPPAPSLNIAVSNSSTDNNNVIYGVTAALQPLVGVPPLPAGPPTLSLNVLPINIPDASAVYGGFNTIAYAPSTRPGATVDLIGAQTNSFGLIWRFFGPNFLGTQSPPGPPDAVQVWPCGDCVGPQNPISMAVDGNGTLYVLSLDQIPAGEGSNLVVELWAFPTSATNASGFVSHPILVDADVAGPGQYWSSGAAVSGPRDYTKNNIDCHGSCVGPDNPDPNLVMDLMIAPAGVAAPVTPDDVLVLFGDPAFAVSDPVALVADYSAANLQAVLSYAGANPPWSVLATPLTVANANDFGNWGYAFLGDGGQTRSFGGEGAVSIAAWPANSSILIMTDLGNIYQFSWSTTTGEGTTYQVQNTANFSQGVLPLGCSSNANFEVSPTSQVATLRTGVESGYSYAFVTQYTCGAVASSPPLAPLIAAAPLVAPSSPPTSPSEVLSLDGTNPPQTATENDGPLAGLAVSGPASAPGGTGTGKGCTGNGCNLTGGLAQTLSGTAAAIAAVDALKPPNNTITENFCIVTDPRKICGGTDSTNALYKYTTLPVKSVCPAAFGNTIIPDYICGSYGSMGQGSGTELVVIQGNAPGVDAIPGLLNYNDADPDFFFDTTPPPCSTTKPEPDILFGWAPWTGDTKDEGTIPEGLKMTELTYGCGTSKGLSSGMSLNLLGGRLNLNGVTEFKPGNLVSFAEFKYGNLLEDVEQARIDLPQKARLLQIVTESEVFLKDGQTQCAARKLWRADKYVMDHSVHFRSAPGKDPNPYGRARSRLANLFFTIYSRIEGNPPPSVWPVARPPGMCTHDQDIDRDGY